MQNVPIADICHSTDPTRVARRRPDRRRRLVPVPVDGTLRRRPLLIENAQGRRALRAVVGVFGSPDCSAGAARVSRKGAAVNLPTSLVGLSATSLPDWALPDRALPDRAASSGGRTPTRGLRGWSANVSGERPEDAARGCPTRSAR